MILLKNKKSLVFTTSSHNHLQLCNPRQHDAPESDDCASANAKQTLSKQGSDLASTTQRLNDSAPSPVCNMQITRGSEPRKMKRVSLGFPLPWT
jgi:hypothetical protein